MMKQESTGVNAERMKGKSSAKVGEEDAEIQNTLLIPTKWYLFGNGTKK